MSNLLIHKNPELIKQVHSTKNKGIVLTALTYGSNKKIWWICEKGHEWETSIYNRAKGQGCPYCSGQKVCLDNCLATIVPDLVKQWHPTKNKELTPYDVTPSSEKKAWWICEKNHEWETAVKNRNKDKGRGCPYCAGKRVCLDNCLATVNPNLAKEWHPTKNGTLTPHDVTGKKGKKVWWKCDKGHEWEAKISNRANGRGCSKCSNRKTSFPEQAIFFYMKQIFHETDNTYIIDRSRNLSTDIYIQSLNLAIEYDGIFYHKNKAKKDEEKNKLLLEKGIKLIRIREEGLPKIKMFGCKEFQRNPYELLDLERAIGDIFTYILNEYKLNKHIKNEINCQKINVEKDRYTILENSLKREKENSLATKAPHLLKEWHPTKNKKIDPEFVASGTHQKIWWKCEKNHEWNASANSRINGNGCPYCVNQIVYKENCLETVYPELAKEWHPVKNGTLTPKDVTSGAAKKVWWKCPKGDEHEWETTIDSRSRGSRCPFCINQKVCSDNCLATLKPELVKEWHPTKNGTLTPKDITPGSNKKVWWKCEKGHEWETVISNRNKGSNCRKCSINESVINRNKTILSKRKSLIKENPTLSKEWHPTKNGTLRPSDVTANSNKKVWWKASCGHEWESVISSRNSGRGCVYCSGRRLCLDNCLATKNPEAASFWDYSKNGETTPFDIFPNNKNLFWWNCKKCDNNWEGTPLNQNRATRCPYCKKHT